MATAPPLEHLADEIPAPKSKSRRRNTSQLKLVPGTKALREQIRTRAAEVALAHNRYKVELTSALIR